MTFFTNRDQPFNGFFANIIFSISFMMDLCRAFAAINAAPIIAFEHYVTLSLPCIGFEILVVIFRTLFTAGFKNVIL